jgi:3-deoxy-D-manno-octulosonate 8-phosphate phosphatase (KDO 8-P phosphatase)
VDGVLTDAGVYYSEDGEELKRFSVRDGMGVELLRESGVMTGFLSRENSRVVRARADKLGLLHVHLGVRDKLLHLPQIVESSRVEVESIAFMGDDVNDLALLERIAEQGLTGAPSDAVPAVRAAVHYVSEARGGHGAFREFCDWMLSLRRGSSAEPETCGTASNSKIVTD